MKHRKRRNPGFRTLCAAALVTSLLAACRPSVAFHSFLPVSPAGMERDDTLRFDIPLPDSAAVYSLCVELRHRVSYPYCELPLLLVLTDDSLPPRLTDTVRMAVADGQGRWLGTGWGDLRTVSSSFIPLPAGMKDSCSITLNSLLPDSLLPGVSDVGIKIVSRRY